MSKYRYLLAVDPSLTCSGWALFSVPDAEVLSIGKIRGEPARIPVTVRLATIQEHVEQLYRKVTLGSGDLLVCEAPTTMRDPHNAIKVEQVRGIFEGLARVCGATVPGRMNPRSVQYEVMGLSGKQPKRQDVKESAVRTVQYLYSDAFQRLGFDAEAGSLAKHQDIVDAILVGRLAVLRAQASARSGVALESMFQGDRSTGARRTWRVKSCAV